MDDKTLIGHLSELRKRLIIIFLIFVGALGMGFYFASDILLFLKSHYVSENAEWNLFNYTDGIMIYLKCALICAIGITTPFALHQCWLFAKPGLTKVEQKGVIFFVPFTVILFLLGISFGYFILFPTTLNFLQSVNETIGAEETYGMVQYFSLLFNLLIPMIVVFQLPVVVGFLVKIGLLNVAILKKSRKGAYFLLIVVGVSITPPDFISDFLIIFPLILLYEFSIFIAKIFESKKEGISYA